MIQELQWIHSKLANDECMRIILSRERWEITCDKTDLVGPFNDCFRIVRANGKITSINPEHVIAICTMKRSVL